MKNNQSLENLLKFAELIGRFRAVERMLYVGTLKRYENDAEHSCMLALLAWYIVSTEKLDLNIEKVMLYALAHDLVEAYAGDTNAFDTSETLHATKHLREQEALNRIEKEFPEFPELVGAIKSFEAKEDKEARFVYALDKIQPGIVTYLDGGVSWKMHGLTLDQIVLKKKDQIANVDPLIFEYFNMLTVLFKEKETELFGTMSKNEAGKAVLQ